MPNSQIADAGMLTRLHAAMQATQHPRHNAQVNHCLIAAEAVLHNVSTPEWVGGIKYNDK